MKQLLTIIICLFTVASTCLAQPGFMGKKRLLEANVTLSPGYVIRSGISAQEWNYSLRYETVTSKSASWIFGLSLGKSSLNSLELEDYGTTVGFYRLNPSTSWSELMVPVGGITYKYQEISIQRNWYFHSMGSVAPYGMYFGLQTDGAFMKQTTGDLQFYSNYDGKVISLEPVISRRHFALSESMVVGNRRIIGRNIAFGMHMALGYVLFQSSRPSLLAQEAQLYNHMDLQENMMVRHFAMRKTLQLGINVGYLF